jgi:hypothetical protein
MTVENDKKWWFNLQSTIIADKRRFEDDAILRRMNRGMDYAKARLIMKLDSKMNPRRYDPNVKLFRPSPQFDYNFNKISPQLKSYLIERRERQAAYAASTGVKKQISEEVKKKREEMKIKLLAVGIDEKTAERMSKTIK